MSEHLTINIVTEIPVDITIITSTETQAIMLLNSFEDILISKGFIIDDSEFDFLTIQRS